MARVRADQLQATLKKNLPPVLLVTGDEPLQVQEACDHIRSAALKQGYTERELYHTDANFDWDSLYHVTNSLSLFADKKIIEIRVHNGKPEDRGSKAIVEYCNTASEDSLLLLVFPKIDKRSQNSKWYKAVDSAGAIVTVWPITPQQLPRWLDGRLKAAGLNANNDAIDMLAAKVEGNLLAAVQEIEKLKLLCSDSPVIDAKTMAQSVISSARYDVYGLVDKALTGHARAACESLQGLRSEGTEAPVVLWALTREIRTLATIKESTESGLSFDHAAKTNGVWDSRKPIVKQAVNRLDLKSLHMLIRKASMADKTIKGVIKADIWNTLLDITLSLSGTQTLSNRTQKALLQNS